MIPLKLHVKNFLSYSAPQDIDFEPYGLICLSGKNGHGKSSLLDALTWALWGQARKVSIAPKADEGLIHLGQTHMMVILDFMCNNTRYRVKREFTLTAKKGHTNVEFGILEPETGTFKPLTETIRGTQETINRTIGLEYEGFINSACMRQGQSHEFSKKSPKERKDILAALLGLDHFEQVRRLALDKAREAQGAQEHMQSLVSTLQEELKEKKSLAEQLQSITGHLQHLQEKEKKVLAESAAHESLIAEIKRQSMEVEKVRFKQSHLAQRLEQELLTIRTQVRTWREILKKQRTKPTLLTLEQERTDLQNKLNTLRLLGAKKVQLKEEILLKQEALRIHKHEKNTIHGHELETLDRRLLSESHSLETAHLKKEELTQRTLQHLSELNRVQSKYELLQKSLLPLQAELIVTREKRLERRKSYYHRFITQAQSLKSTLADIVQKKQLVDSAEQAQCPLCEQLTNRDYLSHKFKREEHLRSHQLARLSRVCTTLKSQLTTEHTDLEFLKKSEAEQQILRSQRIELEQQITKEQLAVDLLEKESRMVVIVIATHTEQLNTLKIMRAKQVEEFELSSAQDTTAQTLEEDLTRLQREVAHIGHDPEKEHTLALHLETVAQEVSQQTLMLREFVLQDERKRSIHERCVQVRHLKKEMQELAQSIPTIKDEEHLVTQETRLKESLKTIGQEKEQLIHQQGALEAQIYALEQKELALRSYTTLLKENSQSADEYLAIASAFSKDGIQALLIEEALPEIEEEANLLLARLTENRAHISIDSLRDTKSGRTKETLDIKISDAVGVRPYEMFSGGEAFRIDFALRIALAKLLARRAGTALQTLIIDEGFGSQDEEGLTYIMQALHMIRDDFEKVIIVSHLAILKEQFPVHFEVYKTPQGSTVTVVEHC
jgi:exonuclease SbcC